MNSAVASVLNKVLGDFVENLDSNQLNLSIFSGTIDLNQLRLKSEALDILGFPFDLKYGFVGKIHVEIPWSSITTSPLKIELADVFVQLSTKPLDNWKHDQQVELLKKGKKSALEAFEVRNQPELQVDSGGPGYMEKMVTKIIDNVQVSIKGIYIRLDDFIASSAPYSFGIVLGDVYAQTCNANWRPEYIVDSPMTYKLARVEHFAIFIDTSRDIQRFTDTAKFPKLARQEVSLSGDFEHQYLISPFEVTIKLELNKNPKNLKVPQAKIEMTDCSLQLKTQPSQITHVLKLLEFYANFDRFRQGVAQVMPKESFSEYQADGYRREYQRWVKADAKVKDKIMAGLEQMENNIDIEIIKAQRSIARKEIEYEVMEVAKRKELAELEASASEGMMGGMKSFFGFGKSESEKKREEAERNAKIKALQMELANIQSSKSALSVEFASLLSSTPTFSDLPNDYVRFLVKVTVPLISISIASEEQNLLEYRVLSVSLEAGIRPTTAFVKMLVEGSEVQDFIMESQSYPEIFRSGKLTVSFDQLPEARLKVRLGQCLVVINLNSILEAVTVMKTSILSEFDVSHYSKAAGSIAERYVQAGKDYMSSVIQGDYEPKHIILDVEIESPMIIFPKEIMSNASFVQINLGSLKATSKQAKVPKGVNLHTIMEDEKIYDEYRFEFASASVKTSANGLESTLLHPTTVMNIVKTCVVKGHPSKPSLKFSSTIDEIKTQISDTQLSQLLDIKDTALRVVEQKMPASEQVQAAPAQESHRLHGEQIKEMTSVVAIETEFMISRLEFGLFQATRPLLMAAMSDLQTRLELKENNALELDLEMRKFELKDMREGVYFNKIFYNPAKGKPQLNVKAIMRPNQEITEATVTMNDFRVVICPETIGALLEFAQQQGSQVQKSAKQAENLAEAPEGVDSDALAVQAVKEKLSMPELAVSMRVINFEIWLPISANKPGSEVLSLGLSSVVNFTSEQHTHYKLTSKNEIISSDLRFKDNEANIEVMQLSIKSGFEVENSISEVKALFKPCRLSMSFNDFKRDNVETQDISLNLEAISLQLGFRDLIHFKGLGAAWTAIKPTDEGVVVSDQTDVVLTKPASKYSEVKRDIKMQCDAVKIVLDNDADEFAYALVMLEISNLGSSILMHTDLQMNATIAFDASYFNNKVNTWEPLIEPYAVELTVSQPSPAEKMAVKLATPEILNFNVTFSLIEALMTISKRINQRKDEWAISPAKHADSEEQAAGPEFRVVNFLGEDIELYIDRDPEITKKLLKPGETHKIVSSELTALLSASSNSYNLSTIVGAVKPPYTMSFKLSDNLLVEAVNIEQIGASGYVLENARRKVNIIIDVINRKSRKYIQVVSNRLIMNNTDFDIELSDGVKPLTVPNGKSLNLPLSWSAVPVNLIVDIEPLLLTFEIELKPRHAKIGNRWVSIDTLQVNAGEGKLMIVQVNPVVTFINLLPGRLSILKNEDELCSLETGKEIGSYGINPTEALKLTLKLQIDSTNSLTSNITTLPELDNQSYHEVSGTIPAEKIILSRATQSFLKNQTFNLKFRKISEKSVSAETISFYAEYLIVNRTDFNIEIGRGNEIIAVRRHSFGVYSSERREVKLRLIGDEYGNPTEWSKDFNIATSGVSGTVKLDNMLAHSSNPEVPKQAEFGILISDAQYPLVKTKLVQLVPRFIFNNTLSTPIYVRQFKQTRFLKIEAGQKFVLNLTDPTAERCIQLSEDNKSWSSAFNIEEVEDFVMKVTSSSRGSGWNEPGIHNYFQRFYRLAVTTQNDATLFINLLTPSDPEFMISNLTNETLEINQKDCPPWQIGPQTSIPYAYDNLLDKEKKILVRAGLHTNKYSLEKVKTQKPLGNFMVALVVEGVRRVLQVCEPDLKKVVEAGLSETLSEIEIDILLAGVGLSIVDEEPKEVLYLSLRRLELKAAMKTVFSKDTLEIIQGFDLDIYQIQIDNMLTHKNAFPVIFSPKSKPEDEDEVPFFQAKVHKSSVKPLFLQEIGTMDRFKMVGLLIQEMQVQLDMQTIMQLLEVVNSIQEVAGKALTKYNVDDIFQIVPELKAEQPDTLMTVESATRKSYFEVFELSAIKVLLSFKMPGKKLELQLDPRSGFGLFRILSNIGVHLASFSSSPLSFKNLIFFHSFQTMQTLSNLIIKNYIRQGIMQFYKILGSSDILGNPIGLIDNLGTGVVEFFSEPYKGMLKGPGEFAGGVAKGVKSLVGNVISGSFGSISKITGSLYGVVREVGGDEEGADRLKQSDNVATGLYDGVKGGVTDLAEGISGLFTKPYQGAKKGGVVGFFKGIGSGVLGAVTSPFSAVLRIGSSVASGIANTGEFLKNGKVSQKGRLRFPRHFSSSRVLTPYDQDLAEAQEWLRVNIVFKHEHLVLFLKFQKKTMALLTDRHLILLFQGEIDRAIPILEIVKCEVHRVQLDYYLCATIPDSTELVIKSKDYNKLAKLYLTLSSMPTKIAKTEKINKFTVPARYSRTCC